MASSFISGPYTDSKGTYYIINDGGTISHVAAAIGNLSEKKCDQLQLMNFIDDETKIAVGTKIYISFANGDSSNGNNQTSSTQKTSKVVEIKQFGPLSTDTSTLYATWTWSKESETEKYKVLWTYDLGDGVRRKATESGEITIDHDAPEYARQSTCRIPENARKVYLKVMPLAKTKDSTNDVKYWKADWSAEKVYENYTPLAAPPKPNVEIDENGKLTTWVQLDSDGAIPGADSIIFSIFKDNGDRPVAMSLAVKLKSGYASYSRVMLPGSIYKVCCSAYNTNTFDEGEWSEFTENYETIPATLEGFTSIEATSENSILLKWNPVSILGASTSTVTYEIEYATELDYFDNTDKTTTKDGIENTAFEFHDLETGKQYYFRIRAVNDAGKSPWTAISAPVIIGEAPDAPTTWSSTTTAIVGEPVTLYWVHNSVDGSSQTYAQLQFFFNEDYDKPVTVEVKNTENEDEKDKTSSCYIDTSTGILHWTVDGVAETENLGVILSNGSKIEWQARTCGVTNELGEWSTMRTIDVYAQPSLDLSLTDLNGEVISYPSGASLTTFPFYVNALAGPNTQAPIGYHVTITSNQVYDTVDNLGNPKIVNVDEVMYSKYFDSQLGNTKLTLYKVKMENNEYIKTEEVLTYVSGNVLDGATTVAGDQVYRAVINGEEIFYCKKYESTGAAVRELMVEFTPANIDLENNMLYTVTCTVSMDSGLRAEASIAFKVEWDEFSYEPNAEIGVDMETLTATVRPYCDDVYLRYFKAEVDENGVYTKTDENLGMAYGQRIPGATTTTGDAVYEGFIVTYNETTQESEYVDVLFCKIYESVDNPNVYLSVYRREYDGKFTELGVGLDAAKNTAVTDPHPALDYARYRIVATSKTTGAVGYTDLSGYRIGCPAIVIQWDEEWTDFEVVEDSILERSTWAGSLLKLPYDVDVSESTSPDVSFVNYIGREHPVGYYGTQLGETATWSTNVPKSDKETIYALRRLAKWTGDVYVREPSGVGYWANIVVSFNQKHKDTVVPVTFNIKRVEGGA